MATNVKKDYSEITSEIKEYAALCLKENIIPSELYLEHKVAKSPIDLMF